MGEPIAEAESQIAAWLRHNIPDTTLAERVGMVVEEAGEMQQCINKMRLHSDRPFRGTRDQWMTKLRKETGDVLCTAIATCVVAGWDWTEVLADVLTKIDGIDLVADPIQQGIAVTGEAAP